MSCIQPISNDTLGAITLMALLHECNHVQRTDSALSAYCDNVRSDTTAAIALMAAATLDCPLYTAAGFSAAPVLGIHLDVWAL